MRMKKQTSNISGQKLKSEFQKSLEAVTTTANAMLKHDLVPDHTKRMFTDKYSLLTEAHNYAKSPFKRLKCMFCQRNFWCTSNMLNQHVKKCSKFHREGERQAKIQLYYNQ